MGVTVCGISNLFSCCFRSNCELLSTTRWSHAISANLAIDIFVDAVCRVASYGVFAPQKREVFCVSFLSGLWLDAVIFESQRASAFPRCSSGGASEHLAPEHLEEGAEG